MLDGLCGKAKFGKMDEESEKERVMQNWLRGSGPTEAFVRGDIAPAQTSNESAPEPLRAETHTTAGEISTSEARGAGQSAALTHLCSPSRP